MGRREERGEVGGGGERGEESWSKDLEEKRQACDMGDRGMTAYWH